MVLPTNTFFDVVYSALAEAGFTDALGSVEHARVKRECEQLTVAQVVGLMIWCKTVISGEGIMGQSFEAMLTELGRYDWSQPLASISLLTLKPCSQHHGV